MTRFLQLIGLCLCVGLLGGCLERRMIIVSDPPGASVTLNGHLIGAAPVDVPSSLFEYYGDYEVLLLADGYEPMLVRQPVPPPWYGYPLVDFFTENVIPYHYHDKRIFTYQLSPARIVSPDELDRKSTRLNSSHSRASRMPSSA